MEWTRRKNFPRMHTQPKSWAPPITFPTNLLKPWTIPTIVESHYHGFKVTES